VKPDLVIRGGTIVDGTGARAFEGDVAIEGDRIAAIGTVAESGREEIDARGLLVTPGFIDVHTHLDAQITWDPLGAPSNLHGVTSVIVGNCGVGFAPCKPQDRDYLMFLMEGVEDIPQSAMRAGLRWNWETFPEYLDALAASPLGLNVGAHLSHAPLRIYAMGERGAGEVPPTDTELATMRLAVCEALRAGAFGFATGRTTMQLYPAAADLLDLSREAAIARLRDPSVRARLLDSARESTGVILGGMATLDHVFPLDRDGVGSYEVTPERSVVALARQRGVPPLELMLDRLVEHEGRGFFLVPLFNPELDAVGAMLEHPLSTIGLGDSGAHTTQTSDASYPTFALAYWVRERRLMPIERMVHKLSGELAEAWGVPGRGVLRRGAYADLNVIDLARLDLRLPEVRHDLPAGAAHLHQSATGYVATVVNGAILMREGVHTGAHPGVVLRNGRCGRG
jgi:N-acyl-D-aspartate/D-glutamate deacylase